MRALLAAGVSREQIEGALAVCFTFNHGRSAVAYLWVLRPGSQGLRGWREVPARAWLPLITMVDMKRMGGQKWGQI
jgi:hypothetical protein